MAAAYNQTYFDALTAGLPVAVVQVSPSQGKGVVARAGIAGGTIVWQEPPLVGIQHVHNKDRAVVCQQCFRFIGSVQSQYNHITGRASMALPVIGSMDPAAAVPAVRCGMRCGTQYCSSECQDIAWNSWHRLLCPGDDPEHAVVLLGQFSENTNDLFLLAARAISMIIQEYQRNGGNLPAAEAPFTYVFKAPWWQVVDSGQAAYMSEAEREEYLETFHTLVEEACCFYRAIFANDSALARLVSKEYVGSLLGMFELNNARMTCKSILHDYAHAASQALGESWQTCDWLVQLHESLTADDDHHHDNGEWDDVDEEMGEADSSDKGKAADASEGLPDILLEGNALYRLQVNSFFTNILNGRYHPQSCLNHSCVPNVALIKSAGDVDGRVVIRALRDIAPGEEVTISYIDESLPYHERREELLEYMFVCSHFRRIVRSPAMKSVLPIAIIPLTPFKSPVH